MDLLPLRTHEVFSFESNLFISRNHRISIIFLTLVHPMKFEFLLVFHIYVVIDGWMCMEKDYLGSEACIWHVGDSRW